MLSDDAKGALACALSMMCFGVNDAFIKMVMVRLSVPEAMFVRGVVVSLLMTSAVVWRRERMPTRAQYRPLAIRTLLDTAGASCFLLALSNMPQANATAIMQALPLAIVAASAALGEHVGRTGWLLVLLGFVGVLIIVRPGLSGFSWGSLAALAAISFLAVRDLLTRRLPAGVSSLVTATLACVANMCFGLALLPAVGWRPLHLQEVVGICVSAAFLSVAYVRRPGTTRRHAIACHPVLSALPSTL